MLNNGESQHAECPSCGETFQQIGLHWAQSSQCSYPELTERQREYAKGLLMGDAWIDRGIDGRNATLRVSNTNTQFLEWLNDIFGPLSCGVRLKETGEKAARNAEHTGFDTSDGDWEFQDVYNLVLRANPKFSEMRSRWYTDDGIQYPRDLQLTQPAALMWYCSDGWVQWTREKYAYASIGTHNEAENADFLVSLFEDHSVQPTFSGKVLRFGSQTRAFLEWLDGPVPGFEYKWETESYSRYKELESKAHKPPADGERGQLDVGEGESDA